MLSGRGLCDGRITRPEESYRVWRVQSVIKKAVTRNRVEGLQKRIPDIFHYLEEEEEEEEEEEDDDDDDDDDLEGVWCAVEGKDVFCLVFVLIIA